MSETPANQFGILTDLPSLSVTVHPSVSIYFCRCSFVFCQLDAALSLPANNDRMAGFFSFLFFLSVTGQQLPLILLHIQYAVSLHSIGYTPLVIWVPDPL